ncbi:uncharacterized protein [Ptychodera flava]|uniref:uncharacterized protein n=1 Tax=Ptychodera flava TaxID=63121 RepID=UPI00396AA018
MAWNPKKFSAPNHESFAEIKQSLDELKQENAQLRRENDDLENRERRNNLVFYGIEQDCPNESWDSSEDKVKRLLRDKLGIKDDIEFERVHRVVNAPPIRGEKPIIAKFTKFKDRSKVLTNANKLKDTNISIGEDFSRRMRNIRAKLFAFRKAQLEENNAKKIQIRYDKLIVTDDKGAKTTFKVDENSGQVKEMRRSS